VRVSLGLGHWQLVSLHVASRLLSGWPRRAGEQTLGWLWQQGRPFTPLALAESLVKERTMTLIAIILGTLLVSACATSSPPAVYGNAKGGAIERFTSDMRQIQAIADTHCRKYSKQARIPQANTGAGGNVFFDCV
jgi:outer membrane murein-binding lipoprotein Lpp